MPDRKIPPKPEHVIKYLIMRGPDCGNCRFRIENIGPKPGKDCKDCPSLPYRPTAYYRLAPVWTEGRIPSPKENLAAFRHAEALMLRHKTPDGLPEYCVQDQAMR